MEESLVESVDSSFTVLVLFHFSPFVTEERKQMMPMHLCQSLCTKKVDQNYHGLVSLVQIYNDSHAHQRVTNVLFSLMLLVNVSINFF